MPDDEPQLEDRVERLESGQGRILSKLDELLGTGSKEHAAAEKHEEARFNRPTEITEQFRMEMERADREKAAKAEAEAEKSDREIMKENVRQLMEKKPTQPQPRRQRWVWGPR